MRNPYRSPAIEQGLSPFRNVNMLAETKNFPEFFFTRKRRLISERKVIRKIWSIV